MSGARWRGAALAAALLLAGGTAPAAEGDRPAGELVALFPLANLAGTLAPLELLDETLRRALEEGGAGLVAAEDLEAFVVRHRVRHTAGVSRTVARDLREETGARAVLLTSLDLWDPGDPPRVAITCRLVSTADEPVVTWMDAVALAGDDHPGLLELGVVHDPEILVNRAVRTLVDSLLAASAGTAPPRPKEVARRFEPKRLHRSKEAVVPRDGVVRVAVVPFTNLSSRRQGGDLVALHLVRQLAARSDVRVVEPGVVRQVLLDTRIIPARGVSLPQGDLLREFLGADLVVSGNVFEYADGDAALPPRLTFSVVALDTARRGVAWTAFSGARGTDGLVLFDRGRIRTGAGLAGLLAAGVVEKIFGPSTEHPGPEAGRRVVYPG